MSGDADSKVCSNHSPVTGTMSPAATSLSFVLIRIEKDRGVAVSRHGDSPIRARNGRKVTRTPYTTPVDVNGCGLLRRPRVLGGYGPPHAIRGVCGAGRSVGIG